jgi:hypothetical protein
LPQYDRKEECRHQVSTGISENDKLIASVIHPRVPRLTSFKGSVRFTILDYEHLEGTRCIAIQTSMCQCNPEEKRTKLAVLVVIHQAQLSRDEYTGARHSSWNNCVAF